MGHRNDIGSIPEIDKYFTDEKVNISEDPENPETVQVLNPTSTSTVLKTTADGKPWALTDGNICIISSDKFVTHEGEFGTLHYADELGFTDVSELGGSAPVQYSGFDDMKNHWASDDVNYMKERGIAAGVGDKMCIRDSNGTGRQKGLS